MVNEVPPAYPIPPEAAIATYSYTDIAEGTGIQILYACNSVATATPDYHLVGTVIASNDIQTDGVSDLDFDTSPFNLPKNIKGTAYISVPIYADCTAGAGGEYVRASVVVTLRHWDGSTEKDLVAGTSEYVEATPVLSKAKKVLVKLVIPLTHFKKGETLRLSTQMVEVKTATGTVGIGHDPKARVTTLFPGTGTWKVTTSLEAHIPFKLDL